MRTVGGRPRRIRTRAGQGSFVRSSCGRSYERRALPAPLPVNDPLAAAAIEAIHTGDVDARFVGRHRETPLHWAASSDDVAVLDALLVAGADIDADGGVIAGVPRLPMPLRSANGTPRTAWLNVELERDSGRLRRLASSTVSPHWSPAIRRHRRSRSPRRSGVRVTVAGGARPSTCSTAARNSTGSDGTASALSTPPNAMVTQIWLHGSVTAAADLPRRGRDIARHRAVVRS